MTEQTSDNHELMPKLRFPEFRDAGEWKRQELSALLKERKEKNRQLKYGPEHVLSVSGAHGCVNQIEFMGRSYAGASVKEYNIVGTGDIVYTKSPLKACPNGIIKANKGAAGIVSILYAVYRPTPAATAEFINYYFSSDHKLNTYLQPLVQKGPKNSILVKNSDVLRGYIGAPDVAEQKKIAECLSSLDALIAAETDKLAALRDHKKGLMQQLFLAEGEAAPRLRFPAYQDAGEWEVQSLGDLAENLDSRRIPIVSSERVSGEVPYYGASGIVDYVADYIFDEDILCISEDGANLVARSTPIAFSVSGKCWINNHAHVLKFGKMHTQILVEQYLNSISLEDFLTGVAQPKLNRAMLDVIPVPLPKDEGEQRKIATCLSSLDTLIRSQNDKVAALESHKSGLMQQLFLPAEATV